MKLIRRSLLRRPSGGLSSSRISGSWTQAEQEPLEKSSKEVS